MGRADWEDGDDWLEDEEGNDLDGDDESPPALATANTQPAPPLMANAPPRPRPGPFVATPQVRAQPLAPNGGSTRVLKVKPMSKGMRSKWPDVSSCLLTMSNGRQVMFVRQ